MKKKQPYIDIGNRLKELRKNLSQKEFAEKIGIPFRTYQNYEYGERLPPGAVLKRVAEICDTTTDKLLGRAEKAESDASWEKIREKFIKDGLQVPENIRSFLEVVSFYHELGIDIISFLKESSTGKIPIYAKEERLYVEKLLEIFRGSNKKNISAIKENIEAFHETRNIAAANKKTPEYPKESGGHGMVGDHPRLDQGPKLGGNSYLEDVG